MGQKRLEFDAAEKEVVAKSNELVRARHQFTTLEQRILVSMVAQLDRGTTEFPIQKVRIADICDLSGTDSSNMYRRIDEITDNLVEKSVDIRKKNEDGRETGFRKYPVFQTCEYDRGSGYIRAQFNDKMAPFLLKLKKRFTLYLMTVFLRLRSKYATQIYEMLKMRQGLYRYEVSVEEFRYTLNLEDKYPRFHHLKQRVIEQARGEMKEKADIHFTYKIHRQNNSPQSIEFFIQENKEVIEEIEAEQQELMGKNERSEPGTESGPESVRARDFFWGNRSQEEVDDLTTKQVESLYETARAQVVRKQGEDLSETYLESMIFRRMEDLWEDYKS